ncbi:hypothetical protein J4210_05870 [Candidatus Woesearchaeota archaeon]|nr:hypothetical protein [Candidatus Woesearchaeota archaeon]
MTKHFIAIVLICSLLLSSVVLAAGNGDEVCLSSEKADYKDLRGDFYDLEDNFYKYRSSYKTSLMAACSSKADLLDDLRDLKHDLDDLRDDIAGVLAEGTSVSPQSINEYGWKKAEPAPSAAAQQSEVVVSTLNSGPTQPTAAVTATVTVEKAPSWNDTRSVAWLVAGVLVLFAVVVFLLGMLMRRR